jgi:hypothetical protein
VTTKSTPLQKITWVRKKYVDMGNLLMRNRSWQSREADTCLALHASELLGLFDQGTESAVLVYRAHNFPE